MTDSFKVKLNNLVSLTSRLELASNENNIKQLSKLISSQFKELFQQTLENSEEREQLRKLRPIIIEIHDKKQNLINQYHQQECEINKDNKTFNPEMNQLFHDFFSTDKPTKTENTTASTSKVYTIEEITAQIDEIFDSEAFLTASGTINQTTQKILLERIYEASKTTDASIETVSTLIDKILHGKKQEIHIPTKDELNKKIVDGIDTSPADSGMCQFDLDNLNEALNQLE